MADKATSPSVIPAASKPATTASNAPKKAARATSVKPRTKPAHPKTGEMVNAAIGDLKERGGSSLQAIKKYIAGTYKVDSERQATFIRKYLKAAVTSGILIQTKGKGAAGSFKLAKADATKPKAKPAAKPKAPKKGKQTVKKTATAKKIVADSGKKTTAKKTASAVVGQKKKVSMGPAAKPPKARTTKAKPAAKSPAKISKPTTAKKIALAAKPKKVTAKKAAAAKK